MYSSANICQMKSIDSVYKLPALLLYILPALLDALLIRVPLVTGIGGSGSDDSEDTMSNSSRDWKHLNRMNVVTGLKR